MLINFIDDWLQFRQLYECENWALIPIYESEEIHPKHRRFCLFYIYCFESNTKHIANFSNTECCEYLDINSIEFPTQNKIYIFGKKDFLYFFDNQDNFIDFGMLKFFSTNTNTAIKELSNTLIYRKYKQLYQLKSTTPLIPISKIVEYCEYVFDVYIDYLDVYTENGFFDYNNTLITEFQKVENNGLYVDEQLFTFNKSLIVDNLVYSQYNPYTSTGRPSNRFGNVNYAALNKNNAERNTFVSRFPNGKLISFDYDAYHLRLLAELVDYTFPSDTNVHTYLGKQYFDTSDALTDLQYAESKSISFQKIYGGLELYDLKIPFFKAVNDYTHKVWKDYRNNGYFETPLFKRKFHNSFFSEDEMNPSKVLNYILQAYETERNVGILSNVNQLLKPYNSKLILYTYDSFLFDYDATETDLLKKLKTIISSENFPIKIEIGTNYDEMFKLS